MRVIAFILFILVFGVFSLSGQSSTSYDVEFSRICLIDSIAPDTLTQFWRFTQANNPGGITRDYTYDLAGGYNVSGTVVPCCSCLTAASDTAALEVPGGLGTNNWGNVGILIFVVGMLGFLVLMNIWATTKAARFACTIFFLTLIPVSQGFAQSETLYDVEFTQICLIDSIAPDTIVQFWRFTHANNPGGITRDYTYDLSGAYIPTGTVLGCNDYYLGDNPEGSGTAGTLAIWTGTETLGNSSLTEAGEEAAWDLTGALTVPSGTDAQVPVWGAGKLRYNTTTGGFQGGPNGYYLPWAVTPNLTAGSVLFATTNGRIQEDNSSLFFDNANNHFGIQTSAPAYHFHVGQYADWRFGGTFSSQEYFGYSGSGTTLVLNKLGFQQNNFSGTSTSNSFNNINVNGNGILSTAYFHSFIGSRNGPALVVSPNLDNNAAMITSEEIAMSFWPKSTSVDIDNIDNNFGVNGGHIVEWRDQTFIIGQIVPVVTRRVTDTLDVKWILRGHSDNSLTNFLEIEKGEIIAPIYGSGNISGTHAYTASFNSSGRLIEVPEKWGTISTSTDGSGDITVAHGMGTTPTSVQITVTGTTPYVVTVHTIDATNFTVRFFDMTGAAVTSTAVTATWHAKT